MANKQDKKILELREQISAKRAKMEKEGDCRFKPITNCSLVLFEKRINLHTLNNTEDIIQLLVVMKSFSISAKSLGVNDEFTWCGYAVDDWIADLQQKLKSIKHNQNLKDLNKAEERLKELLSNEKKIDLELESIKSIL